MDNIAVYLSKQEWDQVMAMIAEIPWKIANPYLMKIGEQLRAQQAQQAMQAPGDPNEIKMPRGNSKEAVQ